MEITLGTLYGRDCIYFDSMKQDDMHKLIFTGEINGSLVSNPNYTDKKEWFAYHLIFEGVLAYFSCELDTYENLEGASYLDGSSFDIIEESEWLQSIPIRTDYDKSKYQHFRLFTYDVVYNIIAVSYQFSVGLAKP